MSFLKKHWYIPAVSLIVLFSVAASYFADAPDEMTREEMIAKRDELLAKRDALLAEREELRVQKEALIAENKALRAEITENKRLLRAKNVR